MAPMTGPCGPRKGAGNPYGAPLMEGQRQRVRHRGESPLVVVHRAALPTPRTHLAPQPLWDRLLRPGVWSTV